MSEASGLDDLDDLEDAKLPKTGVDDADVPATGADDTDADRVEAGADVPDLDDDEGGPSDALRPPADSDPAE